jgi:hypothetical protein
LQNKYNKNIIEFSFNKYGLYDKQQVLYKAVSLWSTYIYILVSIFLPTYQPTLHIRTKYHNVLYLWFSLLYYFTNSNATATLQTQWDIGDQHHRTSRAWSTDEGLCRRLRGSENYNFVQGFAMNAENYVIPGETVVICILLLVEVVEHIYLHSC